MSCSFFIAALSRDQPKSRHIMAGGESAIGRRTSSDPLFGPLRQPWMGLLRCRNLSHRKKLGIPNWTIECRPEWTAHGGARRSAAGRAPREAAIRGREKPPTEERMVNVNVNGQQRAFDGDPSMPLMWYLRDELGLTGTKFGCGIALCGACTVHLDGEAIRSCSVPMSDVAGKSVVTIEGLDPKGEHPVQVAWRNLSVPQCGYCQTGQIIQAAALLAKTPAPTDQQIDE